MLGRARLVPMADRPPSRPAPASGRADTPVDRLAATPVAFARPYGEGVYRRRVRLHNETPTRTVGELEDDFHHFRVELHHDGERIVAADGFHYRGPWSTCAESPAPLRAIEGHPLSSRASAVGGYTPARANCTHLFDLAGLAVAHATRGAGATRQYDIELTDPSGPRAEQHATLWRDGEQVLWWRLEDREVVGPDEWKGAPLRVKFIAWAEERLDTDLAEAAIALRRIVDIAIGRTNDMDRHVEGAVTAGNMAPSTCYTYSAPVIVRSIRQKGSARDFLERPDLLLADMHLRRVGRAPGEGEPPLVPLARHDDGRDDRGDDRRDEQGGA